MLLSLGVSLVVIETTLREAKGKKNHLHLFKHQIQGDIIMEII